MKKYLLLGILAISSLTMANEVQSIGVATTFSNSIYRAKDQIRPLPLVNLSYDRFFINGGTVGIKAYEEDGFSWSVIGEPLGGYFEGWSISNSDMDKGYNIKDRKSQLMGGLSMNFDFTEDTVGNINYIWGEHGSKGEINLSKIIYINDRVAILPTLSFKYYDKEFLNYYVGVSQEEAIRSPKINKSYSTSASFSAGANIAIETNITEQLVINTFVGVEYFDDKISDSPIVRSNNQIYGGIGIRYTF